ncbi:MAG: alkaline phosphatase family protein [Acidobacteriia bacterium]|nr:alkaline phosphatase family protein [Terriglobia bacterium]
MRTIALLCLSTALVSAADLSTARAKVQRVVILKVDGLPENLLERSVKETSGSGRDSHSRLPWIQHVFAQNGVWMENFYVRGLSLSAPSWSLLDSGRHLQIRGNVEYDRYTLRAYDYLNFFPFYFSYAASKQVDMPAAELMDEAGVPLLVDRFPYQQRFQSPQLLQRGLRLSSLPAALKRAVGASSPKDFLDEWNIGLPWAGSWYRQNEADLISSLNDPQVHYLDYFTGEYDHLGHLTGDRVSQLHALEDLDALVGRIWNAIVASPQAANTALVLVSDHGMNTSETIFSQGFSLVDWFNSPAGGAHHVLTNRHPLTEFKLKGLDPFVSEVITPSPDSEYLAGQADQYPTVMLDLDGNERAGIGLRNNTFNVLQILLDQLIQKRLPGPVRNAALSALFSTLDKVRAEWRRDVDDLSEELTALDARIEAQQKLVDAQPKKKKWTPEQLSRGLDKDARREIVRLNAWRAERKAYSEYVAVLWRLLDLKPADFDPGKFKMTELIPPKSLGPANSMWDLRHYVTGRAPGGLVVAEDGSLDWDRSFHTLDYFSALRSISARNNVQPGLAPKPVDFIAIRIPDRNAVLVWRDDAHQALILTRGSEIRYQPVNSNLEPAPWTPGLPLELLEDPQLKIPSGDRETHREEWLSQWHDEREWLEAVHQTRYSNGIIGLTEELLDPPSTSDDDRNLGDRYRERKRNLRRADLLLLANDHWNFNVRGFNPGGNHGSFLRQSTHSVLLFAGGKDTGIPAGLRVETPYDSLSFVPTILNLMGRPEADLPGPVIKELVEPR